MNKNIHKHLNTITEFVTFCFLSVLVLLGGISVITVQAEYAGGGNESGSAADAVCTTPYAANGTTQCNYLLCPNGCHYELACPIGCIADPTNENDPNNGCPVGQRECSGYGCYPINVSCPGSGSDDGSTNENPIPPTCTSAYAVTGTLQCNYAVCPSGCTYTSNGCPSGCLTPDNTENENANNQCPAGHSACAGYGCIPIGSSCPDGNTNDAGNSNTNQNQSGSGQSGESYEASLLVMKGIIKNVGSTNEGLTILNSDTGVSWEVITTDETVYSLNEQPSVFTTLAPQQAIKIFYSVYFESEHLLVAKGIATLNYSPSDSQPIATPSAQPKSLAVPAPSTLPKTQPAETTADPNPTVSSPDTYPIPVALKEGGERLLISQLSDDEQKKFSAHCKEYGIDTATACRALIAENLDPVCRDAGATRPDECDYILRERHAAEYCATRAITNPETCRKFIIAEHEDEILCGDLDAVTCRDRSETVFIGHISAGVVARDVVTGAIETQEPGHITIPELTASLTSSGLDPRIVPVKPDAQGSYLVVPSEKLIDVSSDVAAEISIPYILIPDGDGDGLSDDLEKLYGTDPNAADTDADGFSDATELQSGHDPLVPGGSPQERNFQDTESALLNQATLEQPLYHGAADTSFTIELIPPLAETKGVVLRGTADPNTLILIYIYSKLPMVLTVKTDEFGNWVYDLQESLVEDRHTVYIAVTDKTGRIIKKSNPLSFVVNPAIAVTRTTFLTDEQVPKTQSSTNFGIYYMAAGVLLIATALIFVIANVVKRTNRNA